MSRRKTESTRVSVTIPSNLIRQIDKLAVRMKKNGHTGTRSNALQEVVRRYFLGDHGSGRELLDAYHEILNESKVLKSKAQEKTTLGKTKDAKRAFFLAASRELEAISLLVDPSEDRLLSTILEVMILLKKSTGYSSLPSVPDMKKQRQFIS